MNLVVLARALHSLARIGEDLFVEFKNDGLAFRTVNSAQSAYSTFMFNVCFFSTFSINVQDDSIKCKISIKSCLAVFKTPYSMDKNVESCQIQVNDDCSQLIFQLKYIKGYKKTHFVPVMDNENIQLKYSKKEMPNNISIVSKSLCNAIKHFRLHDEEITFSVTSQKVHLRNYFENHEDKKSLRTELCLHAEDFVLYSVKVTGAITFSLKELRAIILFSELANFPISIYFNNAGRPIIFTVSNDPVYEANYVVSTLPPDMISDDVQEQSQVTNNMSTIPSFSDRSATDTNAQPAAQIDTPDVATVRRSPVQNTPHSNEYNLSNTSINELLSNCPDSNDEYVARNSYRDSTADIIRMQKIKNVFQRCLEENDDAHGIPGSRNVLVYDSEGLMDSD